MRDRLFPALALVTTLAPAAFAGPTSRASLTLLPESKLWVQGTSSVRSYTCRAARVDGSVATQPGDCGSAAAGRSA